MDDDPIDAECSSERCKNVKNNLKMLITTTKKQANDLQAYQTLVAEVDVLRMKLASTEGLAQNATEKAIDAVNKKEIAEAELKQVQSSTEFHKKKILMLQEEADEAEKHKEEANKWRSKYDSICSLAEKLESNNIEVKAKYESAVQMAKTLGKQLKTVQTQASNLKVTNSDNTEKHRRLDKYLKSAIELIDLLSNRVNLSRQPKNIKDLVTVFRRDDIRLYFNSQPYTSSDEGPSTSDARIPESPESEPHDDLLGVRTLSEDEEEEDDDDDPDIQNLEKMLTETVVKATKKSNSRELLTARPDFAPKMRELNARKKGPRIVETKIVKKWPEPIQKPANVRNERAQTKQGLLHPQEVHAVHVPTTDFDAIAAASERRKKALLRSSDETGASGSGTGTTIHGRKGKTVREQQSEMMKGESVKEKVARMKANAQNTQGPKSSHLELPVLPIIPLSPEKVPKVIRHKSLCISEGSDSENEIRLEEEDPRIARTRRSRTRSSSAHPRSRSISKSSETVRRSDRLASKPATPAKPPPPTLRRSTRAGSRSESRRTSRRSSPASRAASPIPPVQNLISQAIERQRRARRRSFVRGDDNTSIDEKSESQDSIQPDPLSTKKKQESDSEDGEESLDQEMVIIERQSLKDRPVGEVLGIKRRQSARTRAAAKRAAPPPLDAGPPTRVKGLMGVSAPKKKETPAPVEKEADVVREIEAHFPQDELEDVAESSSSAAPKRVSNLEKQVSSAPAPLTTKASPDFSILADRENATSTPDVLEVFKNDHTEAFGDMSDSMDATEVSSTDVPIFSAQKDVPKPEMPELRETVSTTSEASSEDVALQINEIFEDPPFIRPAEDVPAEEEIVEVVGNPETVPITVEAVPEILVTEESLKSPDVVVEQTKNVAEEKEQREENVPLPATPPRVPSLRPTLSDLCAAPPLSSQTPNTPKSPKQILARELGLEISDSEEEVEEAEPVKIPEVPKKPEEKGAPVVFESPKDLMTDSDSDDEQLQIDEDGDDVSGPSTSKMTDPATVNEEVGMEPKTPFQNEEDVANVPNNPEPVASSIEKTSAKPSTIVPKIILPPERKSTVLKPRVASSKKSTSSIPSMVPKPKLPLPQVVSSYQTDDDLSLDILAGAKMSKAPPKKVPVAKRTASETLSTPSTSAAQEPAAKRAKMPPVTIINVPPPLKRTNAPRAPKTSSAASEVVRSTSVKEAEATTPVSDAPTTSSSKKTSILIEARRRGRPQKSENPVGMKEMAEKVKEVGQRKSAKTLSTARAHLRQALDLRVALADLKRPLEEKGIVIGKSLPLHPSEATDVMMEFLRETSASDMWAVMMKQFCDKNETPLVNTDEQNFLQVSAALIENDSLLLELFAERILVELCRRETLDSKQCGRYTRLFCHAVHFANVDADQKVEWTRRFVLILFNKHEHHLVKAFAYCLISDISLHFDWLVREIGDPSAFNTAFKVLMYLDSEQARVVNWLLHFKFDCKTDPPPDDEIKKAINKAYQQFLEGVTSESLIPSIYLAKTGAPAVLEVAFSLLKYEMTLLEKQFLEPHEKEKEVKHKTVFTAPTVYTRISAEQALKLRRQLEWQKCVLMIMIDNPNSNNWKAIMAALTEISPKIVAISELLESAECEQFAEPPAIPSLLQAVEHLCQLISEFTNFPLKPTTMPLSHDPSLINNSLDQ